MLLRLIWGGEPGYLDNSLRQNLSRAGMRMQASWSSSPSKGMLLVDQATGLSEPLRRVARYALVAASILMPLGFFLSVASPRSERPNQLIYLVPIGGLLLTVGALMLGVGARHGFETGLLSSGCAACSSRNPEINSR